MVPRLTSVARAAAAEQTAAARLEAACRSRAVALAAATADVSDVVSLAAERFGAAADPGGDGASDAGSESGASEDEAASSDLSDGGEADDVEACAVAGRVLAARRRVAAALGALTGASDEKAPDGGAVPSPDRVAELVSKVVARARSAAEARAERAERLAGEARRAAAEAEAEAREALERLGRLQERQLERCVREQALVEFWTGR